MIIPLQLSSVSFKNNFCVEIILSRKVESDLENTMNCRKTKNIGQLINVIIFTNKPARPGHFLRLKIFAFAPKNRF